MPDEILRYAGFAPESEFDDEPSEATFHVDIASSSLDAPGDDSIMTYGGGIGRSRNLWRPGFYAPSGDIEFATDIKTLSWVLYWALGGYSFDDADDEHHIWGSSRRDLPTFCARLGKDLFEHVFTGATVNSLTLEVEDEFLTVSMEVAAARDHRYDVKDLSELLLRESYPIAFHEVGMTIAGSDVAAKVRSLEIEIDNNVDAEDGRGLGSRHPYRMPASERNVDVSMELWFDDMSELQRFWGDNDGPSEEGPEEFEMVVTLDAGDDGNAELTFPRVIYGNVETQPSGRDNIEQSVEAMAFLGEVDGRDTEIHAMVKNDEGALNE